MLLLSARPPAPLPPRRQQAPAGLAAAVRAFRAARAVFARFTAVPCLFPSAASKRLSVLLRFISGQSGVQCRAAAALRSGVSAAFPCCMLYITPVAVSEHLKNGTRSALRAFGRLRGYIYHAEPKLFPYKRIHSICDEFCTHNEGTASERPGESLSPSAGRRPFLSASVSAVCGSARAVPGTA